METLPIFVLGASGKMGALLQTLIQGDSQFQWCMEPKPGCVVIDFSHPSATLAFLEIAKNGRYPMVVGTTGFDAAALVQLKQLAQSVPILLAPNMSEGVALLRKLTALAAAQLGVACDVEIIEKHHHNKVDAPSGTALSLGETVAKARGQNFDEVKVLSRVGETGKRIPGSIGFATLRGGDIVGEHTVLFAREGEVIEMKHTSFSREHYAKGALKAACWLSKQQPGFYDMDDVV